MTILDWVATLFLAGGAFFLMVSSVGLLRLPDFFTRSHAVGKSETLGSLLLLGGLMMYNGLALESAKLGLILVFIAATNPSGIHVLSRAALRKGLPVWIHPDDRAEADDCARTSAREARAELDGAEPDGTEPDGTEAPGAGTRSPLEEGPS